MTLYLGGGNVKFVFKRLLGWVALSYIFLLDIAFRSQGQEERRWVGHAVTFEGRPRGLADRMQIVEAARSTLRF